MIFPTSEPPQYIVVSPIDSGMKDRFIYHNRYLTIKILNQTAFFEKCACLFSAMYLQ